MNVINLVVVLSTWAMPGPSSGCFVMTKSVCQHMSIKAGKLQKSESSLICVIIAEGSTNALPVSTSIPAHFCIPVSLHNNNVLLRCLINDILYLVIEFFYFVFIVVWCWGVCLYYCDVERDCPQSDGDEPAGDWATSHDSVHDVLVKKKSNAMLVFILFSTEKNVVSFLCCCFAKVLPSRFTESKNVPSVPVHFVS